MSKISCKLNTHLWPPCTPSCTKANVYDPALDPMFQLPGHEDSCEQAVSSQSEAEDKISKAVNHPAHYKSGGMEAIDVIEAFKLDRDFCLGNCAKYLLRLGRKDNELQDAKKCRWYLDRYIKKLEQLEADQLLSEASIRKSSSYDVNFCRVSQFLQSDKHNN